MEPSIGGIVWCSRWQSTGEGPYTLAAKLLNANNLKASYLRRAICSGRNNGASFLDPRPTESAIEPVSSLGRFLREASLAARIPYLYKELADDRQLRYCVKCMSTGFQAATAQIKGIDRCPIHDEAHRNACIRCGSKTPPYRLDNSSRLPSFSCWICGAPFGGDAFLDRRLDAWTSPEHLYRLNPIHRWLERIGDFKVIDWVNVSDWSATHVSPDGEDDLRRVALFDVLSARLPEAGIPESNLNQKTCAFGPYRLGSSLAAEDLTQAQYDGLLRRLILPTEIRQHQQHLRTPSFGVAVPTDPVVPPEFHARLIWRAQFERVSSTYSQLHSRLELSRNVIPSILNTRGCSFKLPLGNSALIEGVLKAVWVAAMKIAVEWHQNLVHIHQLDLAQVDYQWLVSVDRWANRLGCWKDRRYFPVGVIKVKDTATGDDQLYFVVA